MSIVVWRSPSLQVARVINTQADAGRRRWTSSVRTRARTRTSIRGVTLTSGGTEDEHDSSARTDTGRNAATPGGVSVPSGPRGGVITTATLRDATGWDELVRETGQPGLVRHGLRHTALTWMADAGVELHLLQQIAGHQDPAVTSRYLHPDVQAVLDAGARFSVVPV